MNKKKKSLAQPEVEKPQIEMVSFKVFFASSIEKGLINHWQEREVHAFFRDLGLKDKEQPDLYKDALAKY